MLQPWAASQLEYVEIGFLVSWAGSLLDLHHLCGDPTVHQCQSGVASASPTVPAAVYIDVGIL